MNKEILVQYCDLQEEAKDLRKRIEKTERQIEKIEEEGTVKDHVKGGYGGIQTYEIEGFPHPEHSKKKTKRYMYKAQLEMAEEELLELTSKVEEYIQSIKDSRIRTIFRLRYIDNLTWTAVGQNMGGGNTADGVRKAHDRYLDKN